MADKPKAAPPSLPAALPRSAPLIDRLCAHIAAGLKLELACAAEMMGDDWRTQLSSKDLLRAKQAEALFARNIIGGMLGNRDQVESAKVWLGSFSKEFDKRRTRIEYVTVGIIQVARDFIEPERWGDYLDALDAHDTEDVVRSLDPVLKGNER